MSNEEYDERSYRAGYEYAKLHELEVRDLLRHGHEYLEDQFLAADLGLASTLSAWFTRLNYWISDKINKVGEEEWENGYEKCKEDNGSYEAGYDDGFYEGRNQGEEEGYNDGYERGYEEGQQYAYEQAREEARDAKLRE